MRKGIIFLLTVVMILSMVGCGQTAAQDTTGGSTEVVTEQEENTTEEATEGSTGEADREEGVLHVCGDMSVIIPNEWKDKYIVEDGEDGMFFYQKASYELEEDSGYICGFYKSDDEIDWPESRLLAHTGGYMYYLTKPSDVPCVADEEIYHEYFEMMEKVEDMADSLVIDGQAAAEETTKESTGTSVQEEESYTIREVGENDTTYRQVALLTCTEAVYEDTFPVCVTGEDHFYLIYGARYGNCSITDASGEKCKMIYVDKYDSCGTHLESRKMLVPIQEEISDAEIHVETGELYVFAGEVGDTLYVYDWDGTCDAEGYILSKSSKKIRGNEKSKYVGETISCGYQEVAGTGKYEKFSLSGSYIYGHLTGEQVLVPLMSCRASDMSDEEEYYSTFIGAVGEETFLFERSHSSHGHEAVSVYRKVPPEEVRYAATIGMVGYSDGLSWEVSNYNKQHKDARVRIVNYKTDDITWEEAEEKLLADMYTENAPDLISMGIEDVWKYMDQGVLTDLAPFLTGDSEFSMEDILPGIREALSHEDKLYAVAGFLSASTLFVPREYVSEEGGFTYASLQAKEKELGVNLFAGYSREDIVEIMLAVQKERYIDVCNGTCTFDEDYEEFLKYLSKYTEERSSEDGIWKMTGGISDFHGWTTEQDNSYVEEDIEVVGFPGSITEGGNFSYSSMYVMPEKAANKQAAWQFLRWLLTEESCSRSYHGTYYLPPTISSCKQLSDMQMAQMVDVYGSKEKVPVSQEKMDSILDYLKRVDKISVPMDEGQIKTILLEEAKPFFDGEITVKQAAQNTQSRVQAYLDGRTE